MSAAPANSRITAIPLGKSKVYYKDKPDPLAQHEASKNGLSPTEYARKAKVVTADEINRIKKEILSGSVADPNVGVISAQELQRIRQEAIIHTAAEKIAQQKILAEQMQQQQAKATAKKKYMQDLASEAQSQLGPELSDLQQEDLQKQSALRKNAEQVANENRDEVKYMNQLVDSRVTLRSPMQRWRWSETSKSKRRNAS